MNQPPLRRRRRQGDTPDREKPDVMPDTSPPTTNIEPKSSDEAGESDRPLLKPDTDTVERIRSELTEDRYHDRLNESEYWDETHHWGGDNEESVSSDYWHFLGRYE